MESPPRKRPPRCRHHRRRPRYDDPPSSADYLLTFWALITIGAQPSRPRHPEAPLAAGIPTLRHIAANCGPAALLTTPAKQQELVTHQQSDTTLLPGLTVLTPHYQRPTHPHLPASLDDLAPHPVGPDTVVYVQYSSGSTGKPKGVLDTYRCILWQLDVMRITWNSDTPPVSISWLPSTTTWASSGASSTFSASAAAPATSPPPSSPKTPPSGSTP
ncbi:MAG: AMP-binding protein [Lawsonella clevelandensis]